LEIEAWPEDNSGGARFVFGEAGKGVAGNTHGDTRGVGLIAAAVFTERYTMRLDGGNILLGGDGDFLVYGSGDTKCAAQYDCTKSARSADKQMGGRSPFGRRRTHGQRANRSDKYKFEFAELSAPAVGAGEHVDQTIVKTAGLRDPSLDEVLEVKYEWWTSLRKKIGRYVGKNESTAFPADDDQNINLRGVPRQRTKGPRPVYKYL
jgi:hypothetical protein